MAFWKAFRSPGYASMWTSAFVSNTGTWMERTAVGVYVAQTTGRSGWSGLAAAALFIPSLIMAPIGGALADRFERRRYLLVITSLQVLISSGISLLAFQDALNMPALLSLLVATGIAGTMMWPAFNALLTEVVPEEVMGNAIYLMSGQFNLARVVGPLIAAVVIAIGGVRWAFVVNTASFLALIPVLWKLPAQPPTDRSEESLWAGIQRGVALVKSDAGIGSALILSVVAAFLIAPFAGLSPIYALRELQSNPAGASLLMASHGAGGVLAALVSGGYVHRYGYERWVKGASIVVAVIATLFWIAPSLPFAMAAVAGLGGSYLGMMSGSKTICLSRAPRSMRGRISSLYTSTVDGSYGIGVMVIGALGDVLGLRGASLLGCIAFGTFLWFLNRRPAPAAAGLPSFETLPRNSE